MSAEHNHEQHGHHHAPVNFGKAFAIGISLNLAFVFIEATFGYLSHSLALLADAGHNLSDVLGLALAWGASYLSTKKITSRFSYGLKSSSIMAALINAVFLLVATGGIIWESIQRFSQPNPIQGSVVMIVAAIGILINGVTAWLFVSGKVSDINIRGAFLHMLGDALVSLGVVIAGFVYIKTGWLWIDPVVSIAIAIVIVMGTVGLLKETVSLSLHAVPKNINLDEVRIFLESYKDVISVHDLHVWAISTTETALTSHLVLESPNEFIKEGMLNSITHELEEKFHIGHVTIQLDRPTEVGGCVQH